MTGQTMRKNHKSGIKSLAALLLGLWVMFAGIGPVFAETAETAGTPGETAGTSETEEKAEPTEEEDPLAPFTLNHGSRKSRKIAITMDDVYETEWVWKSVELCKEYGITMTFFPIGRNLKDEDRDNWRAVIEAGCEIGSHSSFHGAFHNIGQWIAIGRLGKFQEWLDRTLGFHYEVRWFRPPFGSIATGSGDTQAMATAIKTYGYDHIVRWDVSNTDPDKAFAATQNGSILLYHARHRDYECLKKLIPMLLEAGFEPVTVSELFGFPAPEISDELYTFDIHKHVGK